MKLTFQPPKDSQVHTYCLRCQTESITHNPRSRDRKVYTCKSCGHRDSRAFIIDPAVTWWVDEKGEYCHETAGIFLKNTDGKFLFFERVKHPVGLTVPAGHLDVDEAPLVAVVRETQEETGLSVPTPQHIATCDIQGDECRRGADMHKWHIFIADAPAKTAISIDPTEGVKPIWLSLKEARKYALTPAVRYIIKRFARQLA